MEFERFKLTDSKETFYRLGSYSLSRKEIDKGILLEEGYLCNPFVYMITNRVAEVCASLPFYFCNDRGEVIENSREIEDMFALMDRYSGGKKSFIEKCIANLVALGEFFIYKGEFSTGFRMPEFLDIISPADVTIVTRNGYAYSPIEKFNVSYYDKFTMNPEEMIFGKYANINSDTKRGLSPFEPMWSIVKATNNAFKAHGQLINNMGANGILTPEAGENAFPSTDEERNALQRAFDSFTTGVKNFMKTLITRGSYRWISFDADPNKLKILEMQESSLRQLCAGVNLDSKIFNDSQASTYNNMSEALKSAYVNCFIPTAQYFFDVMARELLPDGVHWKVDEDSIKVLNERDLNYEREVREQMRDGLLTVNEARMLLYPELGDIQQTTIEDETE